MYCTALFMETRPSSIHNDAPTPCILQGDTHLRTQIKPLEQVPLAEREMEVENGGGHQGYRGVGVGRTKRGTWHGLMLLCCEPKHLINASPEVQEKKKEKTHKKQIQKWMNTYCYSIHSYLLVRVKIQMIFSV